MRLETITYTVKYKVFAPGEEVRPTSPRFPLPDGVYVVDRCFTPQEGYSESIVFLKGHLFGFDTQFLLPAKDPVFEGKPIT